ncbi:Prefoldin subunit-domain-containing protein [Stachybotrys elegans]|uniref:Prefoldin subunit-domain-containing protein n=1 Tax=Stachybotrys elegans TaxID=80388 RepID=A0A8K0SSY8_9HYPO|nr:Prefoldin subunit-domain-containing protein [Stachybotrys elegans]
MCASKDSLLDLERHRVNLENTIQDLRKALHHWQTWDTEYEALKEEVDAIPASQTSEELQRICGAFEGELLQPKEIREIFGENNSRSPEQIKNILDRRIDYVTKNIETLQKQIEAAENKLAAATVVSQPDATHEDGAPITDIIETLDDDDNVVSYTLNKPGDSMPQVREALGKAGVEEDLEDLDAASKTASQPAPVLERSSNGGAASELATDKSAVVTTPGPTPKKSVSFSDDVETNEEAIPSQPISRAARRVENIMKTAREQENISKQDPVIPDDEDPDDAALRREMLKYSMGEVGAVVAELQLEEDSGEDDDGWDYMNEDDDDDDDEDEDKWGRSKKTAITDDYRRRMLELEKKLGIKSRLTEEYAAAEAEDESDDERIGRIVVKPQAADSTSASTSTPASAAKPAPSKSAMKTEVQEKKGVRFAQELDIAPEREPAAVAATPTAPKPKEAKVDPLSDIVERSGPSKPVASTNAPNTGRKASRFKKSREDPAAGEIPKGPLDAPSQFLNDQRDETPTGPEGRTIADTLVERDTAKNPLSPDDVDDAMMYSEVASEYQRMRRKFIQREGGFLKEDESPIQRPDEGEGGPEPVSRFKAARHSRQ